MLFSGETIDAPGAADADNQAEDAQDEHEEIKDEALNEDDNTQVDGEDGDQQKEEDVPYNSADLAKVYHSKRQPANQSDQPPAGQKLDPNELNESFWNEFQNNPLGTMQYLIDSVVTNKTAPLQEREQQQQLASNMDPIAKEFAQVRTEQGMTQLFEKVDEIAKELGNPKLAQNPSPRVLRMAAQELFGDSKADLFKKGKQQGAQEAAESRRQKQAVNINTGNKKPAQVAPKSAEREIADSIVAASQKRNLFGR